MIIIQIKIFFHVIIHLMAIILMLALKKYIKNFQDIKDIYLLMMIII